MLRFVILVFTMGSVTSTALRAIRKISPITGRTATSSQHPVRMLFSRRALGVTAATLLVLILLPLRVHGQLDTLPLARTAVLPINTVAGMFENGVHYRLVAASGQVSLFLKNSRGLEFGEMLEIWAAYYDRQRKLLNAFAFERAELTQETDTEIGPLSGGVIPSAASSYRLLIWAVSAAPGLYQPISFRMQSPAKTQLVHETAQFVIQFALIPEQIGFELANRSSVAIKIIWDECAFVDQAGRSHRVIHEGVRLLDRDKSVAPSLVPPGASIRDMFYPASYVSWTGSKWDHAPLYSDSDAVPFTLGLFMTLEVGAKRQTFSYRFDAAKDWPQSIRLLLAP